MRNELLDLYKVLSPFEEVPENVKILITENGGHLGYLGTPGQKGGFHWMDSVLLQWLFEDRE